MAPRISPGEQVNVVKVYKCSLKEADVEKVVPGPDGNPEGGKPEFELEPTQLYVTLAVTVPVRK